MYACLCIVCVYVCIVCFYVIGFMFVCAQVLVTALVFMKLIAKHTVTSLHLVTCS